MQHTSPVAGPANHTIPPQDQSGPPANIMTSKPAADLVENKPQQSHQGPSTRRVARRSLHGVHLPRMRMLDWVPGGSSTGDKDFKLQLVERHKAMLQALRKRQWLDPVPYPQGPLGPQETRRVLHIDRHGKARYMEVRRHDIVRDFSLAFRDLRSVDPVVPLPSKSSILIRERALVVNFHRIKMIVGVDQVVVFSLRHGDGDHEDCLDSCDPRECAVVRRLCQRLSDASAAEDNLAVSDHDSLPGDVDRDLPYELAALEVALAEATTLLEKDVGNVEAEMYPALEDLIGKISQTTLERVRENKRKVKEVRQSLEEMKDCLEDILEDDHDMRDMYLGLRCVCEGRGTSFHAGLGEESEWEEVVAETPHATGDKGCSDLQPQKEATVQLPSHSFASSPGEPPRLQSPGFPSATSLSSVGRGRDLTTSTRQGDSKTKRHPALSSGVSSIDLRAFRGGFDTRGSVDPREVEAVENLLETYELRAEYALGRLMQLEARIDDTEDLIDIDLDNRRNQIVGIDLVVTSVTLGFTIVTAIAGIMGMNLTNGNEDSVPAFIIVTVASSLLGILVSTLFILYLKMKKLMFVPDTRTQ